MQYFAYDPSNERCNYAIPGLQHKYRETALAIVAQECHSVCAWCFRKRIFEGQAVEDDEIVDPKQVLDYLSRHEEIHSLLLSGGDALLAEPDLLEELCAGADRIPHIRNIRIGTRALVHRPELYFDRIPRLHRTRTYVVLHIVHPEEVRPGLRKAVKRLSDYTFLSQTPLLRGIDNDAELMAELWYACADANIRPYYVFHCRPAVGNERFALTLAEGHDIFSEAQSLCTGVVKTPRYVMSNRTGKWEILGRNHGQIMLRCHQGVNPEMVGCLRDASPHSVWWDLPPDDSLVDSVPIDRLRHVADD